MPRRRVEPTELDELEVLPWSAFRRRFAREHVAGEHVAIVGPTGSGKSVLGLELCKIVGSRTARDRRPARVTVFGTKPRDETLTALGWPIVKTWPPSYGQEHCVVWPRPSAAAGRAKRQRAVFEPLMDEIFHEGGQCVFIDEAADFEERLGLRTTMREWWSNARALELTLIAGTQRPRGVARLMWSEPSWIVVFRPDDEDDLKRVASITGRKAEIIEAADRLGGHEFLCIRRQRGGGRALYVSRVDVR